MEKNAILATVLVILILLGYQWYLSDSVNPISPVAGQTSPNLTFQYRGTSGGNTATNATAAPFGIYFYHDASLLDAAWSKFVGDGFMRPVLYAIGFGWTTLVAAEMVAANTGLGQMVLNASNFLRTDIVIMGIVVIGVVAYAFDLLMRYIEHVVVPWKGKV